MCAKNKTHYHTETPIATEAGQGEVARMFGKSSHMFPTGHITWNRQNASGIEDNSRVGTFLGRQEGAVTKYL